MTKTVQCYKCGGVMAGCDVCGGTGTIEAKSRSSFSPPIQDDDPPIHSGDPPPPLKVQYETGAVRSADAVDTAYTLISPVGLRRLAETCEEGRKKYGDYNWEKGMPVRDMLEHAIRHAFLYLDGDRSEDHLAHAAWNLFGAMHSEERWPYLNGNLRPELVNTNFQSTT